LDDAAGQARCAGVEFGATGKVIVEYKSSILNFSFVVPGLLAGMAMPGLYDSLQQDLEFLQMQGIKAILSLCETNFDEQLLTQNGFAYLRVPIPDFTAPTLEQVDRCIKFIEQMIEEKRPVVIHCGAGCGRTGTLLACYFVKKGKPPEEATNHIRALRPCSIETAAQRELVYQYAEHLKPGFRL
jgi:atypical dual specificity phosphatase